MDVNEVLKKYSRKIEEQMKDYNKNLNSDFGSKEYSQFKDDMMPELSRYERWVKSLGSIVKIKLAAKDEVRIKKELDIAHLDVNPGEVVGLAFASAIIIFFLGILISLGIWFFSSFPALEGFPVLFFVLVLIAAMFCFYYFYSMPSRLAMLWRLKASSQMVPAILYAVIYMKHTSNLERAISFVSQHIESPLSLDLRKVLWDVQTGRFSSIKDSLDNYLDFWRESNVEFVESFHLIESSLFEPSENRRIQILERALKVILDGVYERMLKYTHSVKSPLTNLYMLGIVLPTLALALLPLASTLLGGMITWIHVLVFFDIIIPFFVFYLTSQIMIQRPGGYGEATLLEKNPLYYKYNSKKPYLIASLICFPILFLGFIPLFFGYSSIPQLFGFSADYSLQKIGLGILGNGNLFGFQNTGGSITGPFGVFSLLLSLLIPFSIVLFFSIAYSKRTKDIIKERDSTKELENEFNNSLFTLGNRLGDGTPAEIAFSKVAESMKGQKTENFFKIVNSNIQSMGMGLEDAIFSQRRGALVYYPSSLIATSMRILIESVKKGLRVAAESLMSISEYVKNMQKINERLRDLLADVVSDMKSNMTFLAPLLAGIVVGLSAMITSILSQLTILTSMGIDSSLGGIGNISNITGLFRIENMIPPYFMQIAIGIYIIEIIFILTGTLVTIDSGEDKLKKTHDIGKNLLTGGLLYLIVTLLAVIALTLLAGVALGGLAGVGAG